MTRRCLSVAEMSEQPLEAVVAAVASSKKYRAICADTIRRIAEQELAKQGTVKAATKATKRRLHQVYSAFEHDLDYGVVYQWLAAAYATGSSDEIGSACERVLDLHSSTRERLSILDRFYATIFEFTGHPEAILDLGCGMNPLALPWMGLEPGTRYLALDIDADRIHFLNRYLVLVGLQPLARCQDILVHPPEDAAGLAFLLKMSPSLERQEPGATLGLLEQLRTPFVVVSFAVKSLGGREKGMVDHYGRQFLDMVETRGWPVERLSFETELVFVVRK